MLGLRFFTCLNRSRQLTLQDDRGVKKTWTASKQSRSSHWHVPDSEFPLSWLAWYPSKAQAPRDWLELNRDQPRKRAAELLGVALAIISTAIVCGSFIFINENMGVVFGLLLLGYMFGVVSLSFAFPSMATRTALAHVFRNLAERRCGACGNALHELKVSEEDGCCECAGCGAAWKREEWAAGFVVQPAQARGDFVKIPGSQIRLARDSRGWRWWCPIDQRRTFPLSSQQQADLRQLFWKSIRSAPVSAAWLTVLLLGTPAALWMWSAGVARSDSMIEDVASIVLLAIVTDFTLRAHHAMTKTQSCETAYRAAVASARGVCPICAHSLTPNPCTLDGCTLCANCGGATRLASLPIDRHPLPISSPQSTHTQAATG
jgi:hypothetical protein